jgi:hypothetical protein
MDQTVKDSPQRSSTVDTAEPAGIFAILRTSAVKALPEAIIVLVMGNVAVGLVGGIFHEMVPSLPPGVDGKTFSSAGRSISSVIQWPSIREHQFLVVYLIFLIHNLRLRLFGKPTSAQEDELEPSARELRRTSVRSWFRLIVGNAFGALGSAIALFWVQQFSLSQLLWHAVLQPAVVLLQSAASTLFGQSAAGTFQSWISWYGDNQFKFNFWFLYLAAICDDLGVPNLKTLARLCWHLIKARIINSKDPRTCR